MMPLTAGPPEVAQDSSSAFEAGRKLGKREKALLHGLKQGFMVARFHPDNAACTIGI